MALFGCCNGDLVQKLLSRLLAQKRYCITFYVRFDMFIGHCKDSRLKQRSAVLTMAAAVFLLTQVLFGLHHHLDDEHNPGESDYSSAECALCLAVIHHPFDISPEPELRAPEHVLVLRLETPKSQPINSGFADKHQPRAPPFILT